MRTGDHLNAYSLVFFGVFVILFIFVPICFDSPLDFAVFMLSYYAFSPSDHSPFKCFSSTLISATAALPLFWQAFHLHHGWWSA